MFGKRWALDSGESSELSVDNGTDKKQSDVLTRDKNSVFEQLKIFGLEGIKFLSGQIKEGMEEKTKAVFSKALNLFRREDNEGNDEVVRSSNFISERQERDGGLVDVKSLLGDSDVTEEVNKEIALKEKSREEGEKISIIKSFEVNGLGDLFFKLKNVYLEIAKKKGKMNYQGGQITEGMLSKFAIEKIAKFEQGVVENVVGKRQMDEKAAVDFVGHRFKLASQMEGVPMFELVKIDDGKKRVELRSGNFLTFNLFDKLQEKKGSAVANQIVDNIIQEATGGEVVDQEESDDENKFLKVENKDKLLSVVPTSLNRILFDFKKQTTGNIDLYNDYYEVFDMKAQEALNILRKLSKQGNSSLNMDKVGLLNEIIHSTGEPSDDESFGEYLDKYLWGGKLASTYDKIVNAIKILSGENNFFKEGISNVSAKKIFDVLISRLDRLSPEVVSSIFALKIKELMPNDKESLEVYFSRLAARNKNGDDRRKSIGRIVDFLQEITPRMHRIILLDREKAVQQNKNNDDGSVRNNEAVEVPYYSHG